MGIKLRRYLRGLNAPSKKTGSFCLLLTARIYTPFVITPSTNVSSTYTAALWPSLRYYSLFPPNSLWTHGSPWIYKWSKLEIPSSSNLWILESQNFTGICTILRIKLLSSEYKLCVIYEYKLYACYEIKLYEWCKFRLQLLAWIMTVIIYINY